MQDCNRIPQGRCTYVLIYCGGDKDKSRDITLPTKVRLVKAMVFPVVMDGCENWTVKKAERRRMMLLNCGVGKDS